MFEGLRNYSQSFFIVVLVASLATIFGVNFGPGSRGCSAGQLRVNYIARVYGNVIAEDDFRSMARQFNLSESRNPRVVRQAIVDGLIERELLAHEAERLGFRVNEDEINRDIRDGFFYRSLGVNQLISNGMEFGEDPTDSRRRARYTYRENARPDDPLPPFNYEDFELWVRNLFGRTVQDYKALMTREVLAQRMRDAVLAPIQVSADDVWRDYERQRNQVSIRYLQFSPAFYGLTVPEPEQAALDTWIHAHESQVSDRLTSRRESLRNLPLQVRVRSIYLRFPENAEEPSRIATVQRLQALRDRIVAGQSFLRIARLYTQSDTDWRSASDSGWTAPDNLGLPDDVRRVLPNLQPNALSEVIRTSSGVYLVQLTGRRQGNVDDAVARREIGRELYLNERGAELAAEAGRRALEALRAPGATIDGIASSVHADALRAFYFGDVPEAETLPGNNRLETASHSDINAPELRETQTFTRTATIPGISNGDAIVRAAFGLTEENPVANELLAAGDERYVIRLRERQTASRADFDRERDQRMSDAINGRRREVLQQYLQRLRAEAERRGELRVGDSPLLRQNTNRGGGNAPADEGRS